ncbi:MAG: hypothetical protein WD534_12550 [Phycisphaeraceae bacterium]
MPTPSRLPLDPARLRQRLTVGAEPETDLDAFNRAVLDRLDALPDAALDRAATEDGDDPVTRLYVEPALAMRRHIAAGTPAELPGAEPASDDPMDVLVWVVSINPQLAARRGIAPSLASARDVLQPWVAANLVDYIGQDTADPRRWGVVFNVAMVFSRVPTAQLAAFEAMARALALVLARHRDTVPTDNQLKSTMHADLTEFEQHTGIRLFRRNPLRVVGNREAGREGMLV